MNENLETQPLTLAETYKQLRKTTNLTLLNNAIEILARDRELKINLRNLLVEATPAEVRNLLRELGWESDEYESNGWEQDTWIAFAREGYDFCLCLEYSGYYWTMELFRSDIDD